MKKLLLMSLLCCLGLTAWAEDDYRKVGDLWYLLSNDKSSAYVVGSRGETSYQEALDGAITIPKTISVEGIADPIPVTEIRKSVFQNCAKITSITINADLTEIMERCFQGCAALESINIPSTVTSIGIYAFSGCSKLGSVTIPNGVTTIKSSAFSNCFGMTELDVPSTVQTIQGDVFAGCSSLTKVNFASILALTAITFDKANSNPLMNSSAQLWINGVKQTDLVIPLGITTIKKFAFAGLNSVTSVDFSAANLSFAIESDAFVNNSGYAKMVFKNAEQMCSIDYGNENANPLYFAKHIYYKGVEGERTIVSIPASSLKEGYIIRPYILAGANFMTRVNIPDGDTEGDALYIDAGAFKGCGNIEFVGFADEDDFKRISWKDSDANPFANGKAKPLVNEAPLETLTLSVDVPDFKYQNSTWLKGVTLVSGVTAIGEQAFSGCTNLTSVTIDGAALTSIGDQAFHSCKNLGNISLPETVESIGKEAFRNCERFTEITIPSSCTSLGVGAFVWCTQLKTVTINGNIDIPELCCQNCGNLQNIVIASTKNIGPNAFYNCTKLECVPVTDDLTEIGDNAFYGCSKLTNLMLSEKGALVKIGKSAFSGCTGITMISLPATLTEIKENAFAGCTSLSDVYCLKNTPPVPVIYESTFGGRESMIRLHVDNTADYEAADNWKKFQIVNAGDVTLSFYVNDVKIKDITQPAGTRIEPSEEPSVVVVDDGTTIEEFSGWDKTFPEFMLGEDTNFYGYVFTTTTIDNYKYLLSPAESLNGKNLKKRAELIGVEDDVITQSNSKVIVPLTVTNANGNFNKEEFSVIAIGANAFKGQGELAEVQLTSNIESLGVAAFMGCSKLESVKGLSESKVTAFSDNLFQNCTSLSFSAIPANIKAIGYKALSNTGCREVPLHSSITSMGDEVFSGCKSLETVVFAEGFQLALPQLTFLNCYSLKNVTLRGTMGAIGIRAFEGCSALTDFVVPNGIDRIGKLSFNGCSHLQNVSLPSSLTQINEQAFKGCNSLSQIVVEATDVPIAYANTFDETTFKNANVYVNDVAKYKAAETWKNFGNNILANQTYTLTYMVNGEQSGDIENLKVGQLITPRVEPAPINGGRDFEGWEGLPEVMPAEAVVATGKFKYQLSFELEEGSLTHELPVASLLYYDDEIVLSDLDWAEHHYTIVSGMPENGKMPGHDVVIKVKYELSEKEVTVGSLKYKVYLLDNRAEVMESPEATGNVEIPATISVKVSETPEKYQDFPVTAILDNAFDGNKSITGMTLPEGIVSIGKRAFYDNRFTSLTIPASVTTIGSEAFRYCSAMQILNFADGNLLTELPVGVFRDCSSLKTAILPTQLQTVSEIAFYNCSKLEIVTLPSTLTFIGANAFNDCTALMQVIANPSTAPTTANSSNAFSSAIYTKATLYLPETNNGYDQAPWSNFTNKGMLKEYTLTYQWDDKEVQTKQVMVGAKIDLPTPPEDKGDENHVFSGWQGLPEVMPAENITVTGKFKYKMSYSLDAESVKDFPLPDDEWLWYGDPIQLSDALKQDNYIFTTTGMPDADFMPAHDVNVVVKYSLSEVDWSDDGINYEVVLLEVGGEPAHAEVKVSPDKKGNVVIPAQITYSGKIYPVTVIQDKAFDGNKGITGMSLPEGLKKIGDRAFRDCRFTKLTIPSTVESIGSQAFLYCTLMEEVTLVGNKLTELPYGAFQSCSNLETITFPEDLTMIGESAFMDCKMLTTLSLPSKLTEIGDRAFWGCTEIVTVTLTSTQLPTAYRNTFEDKVYEYAVLNVPAGTSISDEPWTLFGDPQEGGATEKCKTPTISYNKGTLTFVSETPDTQLIYTITDSDMTTNTKKASVKLGKKYNISVIAKKAGMLRSDEAKASITWNNGKPTFDGFKEVTLEDSNLLKGDVNEDNKVTITDAVAVVNIVLNGGGVGAPKLELEDTPEDDGQTGNAPE